MSLLSGKSHSGAIAVCLIALLLCSFAAAQTTDTQGTQGRAAGAGNDSGAAGAGTTSTGTTGAGIQPLDVPVVIGVPPSGSTTTTTVDCTKCVPKISSIDFGGGTLSKGDTINFGLDIGQGCTASKAVIIVATKVKNSEAFNTYWPVFGFPAMKEPPTLQAAFNSLQPPRRSTVEMFNFYQFRDFVVDALVKENLNGQQQIPFDFTEPGIEALFSEKLAWVKSKAPEYAGLISGLKEADILNVSDAGFFGLQRTFSKPFAEGMNFKFAVKYDCSGTWRFTDFSNVAFTDSGTPTPPKVPPAAGPGVQPIDIPITIGVPAGGGTGTPTTPGTPATPGTPTTPGTPATPGTPTTPPAETKPVPLSSCNPCQSVVGCLACIDKQMAEQTLK